MFTFIEWKLNGIEIKEEDIKTIDRIKMLKLVCNYIYNEIRELSNGNYILEEQLIFSFNNKINIIF